MTSLATENDSEIKKEKEIKMTSREDINAIVSSGQIPKGEIHYFFNPF